MDILGDRELNVLPTKIHYHSLDNPEWGDCKDETFYNAAKEEISRYREIRDDSDKILKALCYVYIKSSRVDFDNNLCKFLYFWLGEILLKKLRLKELYSEIILDIFKILKNDTRQVCTDPYPYMHKDDFKKVKQIFDISEDYKSYKLQLHNNLFCDENYMTYLNTHVQNYNKFHSECEVETYRDLEKPYCKYFKNYFPKENHDNLSKLKCYSKEHASQSDQLKEKHAAGVQNAELSAISAVETHDSLPHPYAASRGASREEYYNARETSLNMNGYEIDSILDPSDNPSPSITSKSITGAVSVAGILVPSYLMYNYTSAGTWINKVLGRKTRTNFNPYTDQYLMANFSGPENFNSERSRYNIAYSPE
ncbi:Plasmodium vivax Vir protein, putative [Plasmodium vivax]|uniref:Vir protein, putative n=1 Tax=Plasmodium vivax TaxID=5855 RepID=A0A1G4E5W5_PLAVI|nr:Plasmodium vivax Vir protein, putative [Plasmodium vivax]